MALGIYSGGGAGRPCWWIGSQQPSPGPDGRLRGGEHVAASWTIRLCPIASEGQEAAWGGDLGRGQKAKARVSGRLLSRPRTGPRTHGASEVPCRAREAGEQQPGSRAPLPPGRCAHSCFVLLLFCSVITEINSDSLQTAIILLAFLSF